MAEEWLTAREIATRLGMSERTVYRLSRDGRIQRARVGRNLRFVWDPALHALKTRATRRAAFLGAIDHAADRLRQNRWFIVVAGVASILGFMVTIPPLFRASQSVVDKDMGSTLIDPMSPENPDAPAEQHTKRAPSPTADFRAQYLLMDGTAIAAVIDGRLAAENPAFWIKEPFVVPTEALAAIKRLDGAVPRFKEEIEYVYTDSESFKWERIRRVFEEDPYRYLERRKLPWNQSGDYVEPEYFGFVGKANVLRMAGTYPKLPMLANLVMQRNPDVIDVAREDLGLNACGGDWELSFSSRPLKLLSLMVENISQRPLEIHVIEGVSREAPDLILTPWERTTSTVSQQRSYPFPPGLLAPRESILVPMMLLLGSFRDHYRGMNPEDLSKGTPERTVIPEGTRKVQLHVPAHKPTSLFHNEYLLGPWFETTKLGDLGRVRMFRRSEMVYNGPFEIGSCPLVYRLDEESTHWDRLGTLISDRKGRDLEGESRLRIAPPYPRELLIREQEDEVSHLDAVCIELELHQGSTLVCPDDKILARRDGQYLDLRKGEEIILHFPAVSEEPRRVSIVSFGYFDAISQTPTTSK